ncbi:MAG: ATP-binding cassette domain-containing protein [Gammaproteobacteria bacterium]
MKSVLFICENLKHDRIGPVNLKAEAGQCVSISGRSGAGKTQLLRALADLDPHHGDVFLNGIECNEISGHEWRRKVAMLPAESQWWYVHVGGHLQTIDVEIVESLGFERNIFDAAVDQLSTGERQRLALIRLLAIKPRVLLLDEPTASLDPENTERVEDLIKRYKDNQNATVIWVSHDQSQIDRVSDQHYFMKNGALELQ